MSLRLIYGRAGTGKSSLCFDEIKDRINDNKKIYIITPEQFSFTAEKSLVEVLGNKSVINAEVISFERIGYRVLSEIGGYPTTLTKSGKMMLIYNILTKNRNHLKFLGNSDENVETLERTISDFKKHNVKLDNIQKVHDEIEDNYLKNKLEDLIRVYQCYEKIIESSYIDEEDRLTILAKLLPKSDMFIDSIIYIDEFAGFTKQEFDIIEILLKQASQVNITITTDNLEISNLPETDVFYSNKVNINQLLECAKKQNAKIEEYTLLDKQYRFKNEELNFLEKNIAEFRTETFEKEVKNINLFLGKNPYDEINNAAKQILKLVKEKGIRYKDIAIISNTIENNSTTLKIIFNKYNIPVFIDTKKDLSQNILIKYILSVFDILAKNWSYETVFNYLKLGLTEIDINDIYELENYCRKYGIKGKKWHSVWDFGEDDNLQKLNELRISIITPLLNLKENLDKSKDVKNITSQIYYFLENNNILNKIRDKIKNLEEIGKIEIANEYATSINVLMNLFDEIVALFENEKMSLDQYRNLLKQGLSQTTIGKIPATCDQVIVGDVYRSISHKVKVVFMIGLNDGVFPSINTNEGFINDKDRLNLQNYGIELAKGNLEKLYENQYYIYKAFSTAEEQLYLSYSSTDKDSKSIRPSLYINRIKKLFPKLIEKSDVVNEEEEIINKESAFEELLQNIREKKNGKQINKIWYSVYKWFENDEEWSVKLQMAMKALNNSNKSEIIDELNVKRLYGNTLNTSISRLEQYQKCPFSFHLKYGLNLKSREEFKIKSLDTGTFMHEVIDEFFDIVNKNDINIKELDLAKVKNIIDDIINSKLKLKKNYIFTSNARFITLTNRLKKVVLQSILYIIEQLKCSEFDILGNEIEFSKKSSYPPISIKLDNGNTVEIIGKIDRVDIARTQDKKYIRIIDYKSSAKNIDLNEVIAGLQIQLLTYLDAMTKIEDVDPAGILYFQLMDPIIKNNKNLTDEEISEEIKKRFKMQGLLLADIKIIRAMDKNLNSGYSDILPVYIDKDGNISKSRSNVLDSKQFESLQRYINKLINQISKEILKGKIDIKPCYELKTKNTPCEFCEYRSICQFNTNQNEYKYITNLSKEECIEKMEKEIN